MSSSGSRAVTIIGAGVRVKGNIAFSGFLRVDGDVLGNVSCDSDSSGTTAVHGSGSVTGTIKTPHIVVGGRVHGPLHASESIEIHRDACVVGDACYKQIVIHAGGVIEGSLTPTATMDSDRSRPERRIQVSESPVVKDLDMPLPHDRRSTDRYWSGRKLGAALALIVAIVAVVWVSRGPTAVAPPVAVAPEPESSAKSAPAMPTAPTASDAPQDAPRAVLGDTAPLVPNSHADTKGVVPTIPPERPKADPNKVVAVEGMDTDKPADIIFVNAKEPSVLLRKQRNDPGDGTRVDLPPGAKKRISIAEGDIVRIAEGRDIVMFYQGGKVPPKTIESGVWISFVPLAPGGASEAR